MASMRMEALAADYFRAKAAAYTSPMTVKAWFDAGKSDFVLVDVRIPAPQMTWRIPGSIPIPADTMEQRFAELPKDKLIVLYCWDTWCSLATTAALVLVDHGYRVKELFGGVAAWKTLHLPEEAVPATAPIAAACSC
ncbi:MAG: rhodanese-like domain-containing protein [Xanthobacteraceae bacterium]